MKKMATILAGATLMMGIAAGIANATSMTLSNAELLMAQVVSTNNTVPSTFDKYVDGSNIQFEDNLKRIRNITPYYIYDYIGVDAVATGHSNLTGYATYDIMLANTDQSNWEFASFIQANGTKYLSSWSVVAPNSVFNRYSFDLSSLSALEIADIEYIGFGIRSKLLGSTSNPNDPSNPDVFHVAATSPVPEPGTMMLLGLGFFGLAILGKRRMNKDV